MNPNLQTVIHGYYFNFEEYTGEFDPHDVHFQLDKLWT